MMPIQEKLEFSSSCPILFSAKHRFMGSSSIELREIGRCTGRKLI